MASVNVVHLLGNVTRDIELKFLPNNTACAEFGLAMNRKWGEGDQKKEEVTFVDCTAFGNSAETISKYVKKGDQFWIAGRLKLDQWEAQDGTKRSKLRVVVESFQFLGAKREAAEPYQGAPQRNAHAQGAYNAAKQGNDRQTGRKPQPVAAGNHDNDAPPDDQIPF